MHKFRRLSAIIAHMRVFLLLLMLFHYFALSSARTERRKDDLFSLEKRLWDDKLKTKFSNTSKTPDEGIEGSGALWPSIYIHEQDSVGFEYLVKGENSLEERVANLVDTSILFRMAPSNNYGIDTGVPELDQVLVSEAAGRAVDDELCSKHLKEILDQLLQIEVNTESKRKTDLSTLHKQSGQIDERHVRLARFLDSFAHYDGGIQAGRELYHGSYEQCRSSTLLLESGLTKTRYCKSRLSLIEKLSAGIRERRLDEKESPTAFTVGICLPESCHSRSFNRNKVLLERLVHNQFKLPREIFVNPPPLISVSCEIDEDSKLLQMPLSGITLFVCAAVWLALVALATYRHAINGDFTGTSMLDRAASIFSLKESWDDLIENRTSPTGEEDKMRAEAMVNFDTLNPVRSMATFSQVLVHSLLCFFIYTENLVAFCNYFDTSVWSGIFSITTNLPDTFLIIAGMIMCYSTLRKLRGRSGTKASSMNIDFKTFLIQWFGYSILGFMRMLPPYYFIFWCSKSVITKVSSGPNWDLGFNRFTPIGECKQESWLSPLTFQSAFLPLLKQCTFVVWFNACYFIFRLALGPLIYLFHKRPKQAILLTLIITMISHLSLLHYTSQMPLWVQEGLKDLRIYSWLWVFKYESLMYTAPHCRVHSFAIGLIAGFILNRLRESKEAASLKYRNLHAKRFEQEECGSAEIRWPYWFRKYATAGAWLTLFLYCFITPVLVKYRPSILGYSPHRLVHFYAGISSIRLLWNIGNAVIFMRMVTDWKKSSWMRNFSSKFWRVSVKLSYAILLIHPGFLYLDMARSTSHSGLNLDNVIKSGLSAYILSLVAAFLLHIIFENPVNRLIKSIENWKLAGNELKRN